MDNLRSERGGSNTELEAAAFRKLLESIWIAVKMSKT